MCSCFEYQHRPEGKGRLWGSSPFHCLDFFSSWIASHRAPWILSLSLSFTVCCLQCRHQRAVLSKDILPLWVCSPTNVSLVTATTIKTKWKPKHFFHQTTVPVPNLRLTCKIHLFYKVWLNCELKPSIWNQAVPWETRCDVQVSNLPRPKESVGVYNYVWGGFGCLSCCYLHVLHCLYFLRPSVLLQVTSQSRK